MNALTTAVPSRVQLRHALRHRFARGVAIAAVAMTAVTLTVGVAFAWWPAREATALTQIIERARHDRIQADRLKALSATYNETRQALPVLERKLMQPMNQARAIEALRVLAVRKGLRVGNASYGQLAEDASYSARSHELNVIGSYSAVKRFLAALPQLATYTTVLDLRIEPGDRGRSVRATVRLATFGAPAPVTGRSHQ